MQSFYIGSSFDHLDSHEQVIKAIDRLIELQQEDPESKSDALLKQETKLILDISNAIMKMWDAILKETPWNNGLPKEAIEFQNMLTDNLKSCSLLDRNPDQADKNDLKSNIF